jgi:hypothetical protein
MELNKENFKATTVNMRNVLVYMTNREDPFTWQYISNIADKLELDEYYMRGLVSNLIDARLMRVDSKNSLTPSLTHVGLELGQDLANDDRFNLAVEMCEKQDVYSLSAIAMTVRQLAAKTISEEINKQ